MTGNCSSEQLQEFVCSTVGFLMVPDADGEANGEGEYKIFNGAVSRVSEE